jgi:uncharacterized surface protein with fasciclin (FAS1) repeats
MRNFTDYQPETEPMDNSRIFKTPVLGLSGIVALLTAFVSFAGHHVEDEGHKNGKRDIVNTAVNAGTFTTLITAVKTAGLEGLLKGKGPYTVFAPTDETFARLPDGTLEALQKDPDALKQVLTCHVVPGKVTSQDVAKLQSAKTVQGQSVNLEAADGVKINDANVIMADVMVSNGVIHVIDRVIIPE